MSTQQYPIPEGLRGNVIPKNVVKVYEELVGYGFPVKWTLPNRVFVLEGDPWASWRFVGLKRGSNTYAVPFLIQRS